MNKDSLLGTGKVYRFTLRQLLKSKANRATFILFALIAILAVPVASLIMGGEKAPEVSAIKKVYIANDTIYELDLSNFGDYFKLVMFENVDYDAKTAASMLEPAELYANIHNDETAYGGVALQLLKPAETTVTDAEIELLCAALCDSVTQARYEFIGIPPAQVKTATADFSFTVMNASEYDSDDVGFAATYAVQYAYAIVLLMISMFSIVYIIRAIIEEKASKLVELLMVTTKPLALLLGKLLAVMTYIFGMLVAIVVLFAASFTISGNMLDVSPITGAVSGMGLSRDILNLGPAAFIAVFVSLLLAYMTFSIIAGLSGTSCSTMDDVESANMSVTFVVLGAYILSMVLGMGPLAVVGSLVPVISAFVAPVQYILGGISFWVLALSWVIQLAVIALLAMLSSRVYSSLIIHSGSRVKLKTLLAIYKQTPGKEVQ